MCAVVPWCAGSLEKGEMLRIDGSLVARGGASLHRGLLLHFYLCRCQIKERISVVEEVLNTDHT